MIPGSRADRQVQELKPWARAVVTAWVLLVIPVLLYLLGVLIVSAPQLYATAWDAFFVHYDEVRDAFGTGKVIEVAAGLLQIVLLVIPVAGVTLTFVLVGKGLSTVLWRSLEGKRLLRICLAIAALGCLAIAALGFVGSLVGATLADDFLSATRGLTESVSSTASSIAESLPKTPEEGRRMLVWAIVVLTGVMGAMGVLAVLINVVAALMARGLPTKRDIRSDAKR
jgi:putative peptide zinc metalloprotease protein